MIAFVESPKSIGWQEDFLLILPKIKEYARRAFYNLRGDAKDDAICEVIARCISTYRRLYERNELHRAFVSILVENAVRQYYRGRRVGTPQCSRDLYATKARQRGEFQIRSIGTPRDQRIAWMESLTDNHSTPVPEQAHFRIEFRRWLRAQTPRNRGIAETLAVGYTTAEVAGQFRLSPGRVSQLRKEFWNSWNAFCGQPSRLAVGPRLQQAT